MDGRRVAYKDLNQYIPLESRTYVLGEQDCARK